MILIFLIYPKLNMSKIILLNGPSSAGKSSIVKAIQWLSDEPWLSLGVDYSLAIMPSKYLPGGKLAHEGIDFVPGIDKNGYSIMKVEVGDYGKKVSESARKFSKYLTDDGHNIILDEVIWDQELLNHYLSLFKNHSFCYVIVKCDLERIEEREIIRGDRSIGLAREQLPKIKNLTNYRAGDLTIDTTYSNPFESARLILNFFDKKV